MSSIEVAGSAPRANDQGLFQCGSCKRNYNRLDHLARHVRSHTNFKPHRCSVCSKSFSRTDLLKRHVAAHDVRSAKVNNLTRGGGEETPGRVSQACRACAANHVRCTESKPCRRCAEKGVECVFSRSDDDMMAPAPMGSPRGHQMSPSPMPSSLQVHVSEPIPLDVVEDQGEAAASTPMRTNPYQNPHSVVVGAVQPIPAVLETAFGIPEDEFLDVPPQLPTGCCTPTFAEWDFLPGLWSAGGDNGLGMEHPFPGIELDDLDLRFLDTYNISVPFEFGRPPRSVPSHPAAPPLGLSNSPHPASSASEAFLNHHWRFRPNPKDNGAAEEHNLSLPSDGRDQPSPDSQISFTRRVTPVRLGAAARDNILTIIIQCCRPENLPKVVASFPSVELLDTLIQFYLTSTFARADSFIHAATFDPNEKKPELLLAMAAAGAVLTADPTLVKLGYAMQECIRTAIPKTWESDNTLVRNLELTQGFLINLETGLWSGLSRKVEITESFLQASMTMFRRGARFRKSSYPTVIPDSNQAPEQDEASKWHAWIQHESYKRTAFRLIQHDLNSSTYLMVNPLASYAELTLPLPCAPSLWNAPSPQHWRSLLTQHPSLAHQPPSLPDYLDDLSIANPTTLDLPIAHDAFLFLAWSLAWECMQLTTLQHKHHHPKTPHNNPPTSKQKWNPYLLPSRRDELLTLLSHFRVSLPPLSTPTTHRNPNTVQFLVRMRLDLTLLHLHTPFEEVQIFAGIEGPEQARAAYPSVLEWAGSEAARKAVGCAGQVVRVAAEAVANNCGVGDAGGMGKGTLQGPAAVVMYQASLVLWV
ncbi:hypothetical protein C8A05DRAFT_38811, partial [Staphylotrichum tortipilum]